MRIAAIDVGTNSIHMVIAESLGGPSFSVLDREREVVQIGRGSFETGRLQRAAIVRTVAALRRFVQLARRRQVDRILCTATAAVREARNGGDFLREARREAGVGPRVIPAEEEGRLIHLAVQASLQLDDAPTLVVDIGGGSVQLVRVRRERLERVASAPLGALRLTETVPMSDPPQPREISRLRRLVRKRLRPALRDLGDLHGVRVLGSSGAIHALGQLASWESQREPLRQVNGYRLRTDDLESLTRRLARMTREQRERLPGIDAPRAEILVPGAVVLLETLRELGAERVTLSDYGVREGLVTDWLHRHARELSAVGPAADLRMRSVLGLLARLDPNGAHARHVARLSTQLFDALAPQHGFGPREREWLEFASLLHDAGSAIAYDGHAQHSAYVIRHGGLRGLTEAEVEIVASIARYHGKSRPRRRRDAEYAALTKRERRRVRWLSAILRVAEGLDRSHYQLIRDVRVVRTARRFVIVAEAKRHAQLELWAGRRRARDLERLLSAPLDVQRRSSARPQAPRVPARATSDATPPPASARAAPPIALRLAPASAPARTPPATLDRSAPPASAAVPATQESEATARRRTPRRNASA